MPDTSQLREQLHHAQQRIGELERLWSRDQALLRETHAQLHAIRSTYAWKLAELYYRWRERILPTHSRRYRWFKQALKFLVKQVRQAYQRLRPRFAPGGRLGYGVNIDDGMYRRWIRRHEPSPAVLARQRRSRGAADPLISIVMPVYRPPLQYLRAAVDSVREQTYERWELCIAAAEADARIRAALQDYAARDSRVRVVELPHNGGIAVNTNAAIEMVRGQYVGFLDHDDTLSADALWEAARVVAATPDVELIYTDEDKLDALERRTEPQFKPGWSPEQLRSRNYVCHWLVLRRELLQRLGGLREGFDGAQDYDLVLRASEVARRIVHVPRVLYHWRMHAGSTADGAACKPDAAEAGRRALAQHLDRVGIPADVEHRPTPGIYRVRHRLSRRPLVSVIIPNHDQPELLAKCLETLAACDYSHTEVLIVENGSRRDDTFEFYRRLEAYSSSIDERRLAALPSDAAPVGAAFPTRCRVLEWRQPFNYAAVNNFAARHASGEHLLFLNNDIEATHTDWLTCLVELAELPGVGAVGAKLIYPDGTVQHGGIILGMGGIAGHAHLNFPAGAPGYLRQLQFPRNCAAVTAACMLVPKRVFDNVGGFDEGFVLAFNDVDLCLRIGAAGFRIVWTPDAELLHHESKTRGLEDTVDKRLRFAQEVELFRRKWHDALAVGDPFYPPQFRLDRPDWVLRD